MAKKYAMLHKADAKNNSNKYYEITLNDDDSVSARYGRVGDSGVTEHKGYGESAFDKVFKAKTSASKGYTQVDIAVSQGGIPKISSSASSTLAEIAKRDIANNDPTLASLLERLAKINKYQLLQATDGQIDIVDGIVQTAVGPITLDAVSKARSRLIDLDQFIQNKDYNDDYTEALNQYLRIVPQKVPRKRGWDQIFFTEVSSFQKQSDLLDQIEGSILNAKPVDDTKEQKEIGKVFGHSLKLVDDGKVLDRIKKFYDMNMNSRHVCSHLKLKNIYEVSNPNSSEKYKAISSKIGNEKQLWHGTRAFNVLSILKGGLIIPTSSGGYHITGRMFGDGLYFSDQSTKSLNYAYGYWGGGGAGYDNNCFMFLADVAMGNAYVPPGPLHRIPSGYDSCNAIGGKSGVQNNEMIVYSLDQANLRYLCEFDA